MNIDVKIDSDAINRAVTDAIINSALGAEIEKAIKDVITAAGRPWDSPIKKVVERFVNEIVYDILSKEHQEVLRTKVRELITDELLTELVHQAWGSLVANKR